MSKQSMQNHQQIVAELKKELAAKNRELEIETSLERVRTTVLEMRKQDDLMYVAKALLKELDQLGFSGIRNTQIDILDDEKKTYLNYLHSDYGVSGITEYSYNSSPVHRKFIDDVKSSSDALFFMEIKGKELDEWRERRKNNGSLDDPMLEKINALYFYSYSIGTGAVGISTFEPIDNSKLEIIKKFRNVFFLSYRRFHDIVVAEKQAREAQIEASLERIRARSMAMHHSRELVDVVRLLDKEIKGLGIQFVDATQILTDFSNPEEGLNIWITVEGVDYLKKFHVPYFDHPTWFMLSEALKKGQNFYTEKYLNAEKNRYFRLLFKYSDFGRIPKERQAILLDAPGMVKS